MHSPDAIRDSLPNGFHDAILNRMTLDFCAKEAFFEFRFWVGSMDRPAGAGREARRDGILRLTGVTRVEVGAPDARYEVDAQTGIVVDGDFGEYPGGAGCLAGGEIGFWLYVSSWNSRMTFSARACRLEWKP